ncbi:MAG: hypothetical protein ACXWDO_06230, partial [Bacteroidia bacterium]
ATFGSFILAFALAIFISFKRDLRKKQLDTVFDLVSQLQNLKIYIACFINSKEINLTANVHFNFFDLTSNKLFEQKLNKGRPKIYVSEEFLYENEIFKFVHNPFLPKDIALNLINLYPRRGNQTHFSIEENRAYISDTKIEENLIFREEISSNYKSLTAFFKASENLSISIKKWLKIYGVSDLNLIDRPINIKNYP